jgi:hypothetical protein
VDFGQYGTEMIDELDFPVKHLAYFGGIGQRFLPSDYGE